MNAAGWYLQRSEFNKLFMPLDYHGKRETGSTVKARFWDFETNAQQSKIFDVDFVRNTRNGSYMVTDEREKYEMMASNGARRLRACMQAGIPSYLVDQAVEACEKTLAESVNKGGVSIEQSRQTMLETFQKLVNWVTPEMLGTDAEKQIISTLEKVKNEIGIIRAMKCSCEQQMLDCYLQTLNLSAALAEKTRREEQDKCLMAYQDELPIPIEKPIQLPVETVQNDEPIQQLDFRVWVIPTQKAALKLFLNEHQIKVGRVL